MLLAEWLQYRFQRYRGVSSRKIVLPTMGERDPAPTPYPGAPSPGST